MVKKGTLFTAYSHQNYLLRLKHLKGMSKKQIVYLLQLQLYESITSRQLTNQLCSTSIDVKQMSHKLFKIIFLSFSFSFTFRIWRHWLTPTYFLNNRKMYMISEKADHFENYYKPWCKLHYTFANNLWSLDILAIHSSIMIWLFGVAEERKADSKLTLG